MLSFTFLQAFLVLQLVQHYNCQCVDATPSYTCEQRKKWGECDEQWIKDGDFCAATCGRCLPSPIPSTIKQKSSLESSIFDVVSNSDEIFRSSVQDGDCSAVCSRIDICNAWVMCKSSSGCQLGNISLPQGDCAFQTSVIDPTPDGSGDLQFFVESGDVSMMKKGAIEFQKIEDQKSALEYLQDSQESIETGTFADLALSPNVDVKVQDQIGDVDFAGILCIPSNDAFNQFFDNAGVNAEDLKSDAEALTQVIEQNIIPGSVNLPGEVGDNITADSLLQGSSMVITRLPDMGLQVCAEGMEIPATKTRHIDIGSGDLVAWELDQVLIPPAFTVSISVSNKDVLQFLQGQPGLTIFQQILKSPNLSLGINAFIAGNSPGRLFAPTDRVFDQFFQKYAVTLDDFLKFSESVEVIGSLLVYDLSLTEKDVFENEVWNFGNTVDPQVSLKADLNEQASVWVVNRLYIDEL